LIKSELEEVYINLIMQSFALSLISIFVPIYLIKLGYSVNQALIFIAVEYGILSLFTPAAAILAKRFGLKHIILYRTPLVLLYISGLYALTSISLPIYWIAALGGVGSSMYWFSLHSLFAKHSNKIHRGLQAGKLVSFSKIAAVLGPGVGGVIALYFGFQVLFITGIILLCVSVVPLFFTGDMKPHVPHFTFRQMVSKKNLKLIAIFTVQGFERIIGVVVWPVFVYFMLADVSSVGFVGTLTALGTVVVTLYLGRLSDTMSKMFLLKIGGILVGATFLMRMAATDMTRIFVISFLAGLFGIIIDLPLLTMFYDKASKQKNCVEVVVMRELGLGIGRVAAMVVCALVIHKFIIGFSLAGIASLLFSFF
jgi:MFS family permease